MATTPTTPVNNATSVVTNSQQASTAQQAVAAAQQIYNSGLAGNQATYGQTASLTGPYIKAGAEASNAMASGAKPYVAAGQTATQGLASMQNDPLNVNAFMDPSMQFSIEQGQKALERSAAARGGVLSGGAMQDLAAYATGIASQNYNNAAGLALKDREGRSQIGEALASGGLTANGQYAPIIAAGSNALSNQTTSANTLMGQQTGLINNNASTVVSGTNAAGAYKAAATGAAVKLGTDLIAAGLKYLDSMGQPTATPTATPVDPNGSYTVGSDPMSDGSDESLKRGIHPGTDATMAMLSQLYGSDRGLKKDVSNLSPNEINKSLDGMNAKTYEYTPEARAQHPDITQGGRKIGIIAQDVEKTPANDMVEKQGDGTRVINMPKATSFALAALSVLGKRIDALEARK